MYYIEYGTGNYFDDDEITVTDTYERDLFCCHMCMGDFCLDTFEMSMEEMFPADGSIYDMGPVRYTDGREVPNADRDIMIGGNWEGIELPEFQAHCASCEGEINESD